MNNVQKNNKEIVHEEQKWVNMRIKEELIEDLRKIAKENDRNLTQQINWMLKQAIKNKK